MNPEAWKMKPLVWIFRESSKNKKNSPKRALYSGKAFWFPEFSRRTWNWSFESLNFENVTGWDAENRLRKKFSVKLLYSRKQTKSAQNRRKPHKNNKKTFFWDRWSFVMIIDAKFKTNVKKWVWIWIFSIKIHTAPPNNARKQLFWQKKRPTAHFHFYAVLGTPCVAVLAVLPAFLTTTVESQE